MTTMTGTTTRPITFVVTHPVTREVVERRLFPTGTPVVCKQLNRVMVEARVVGTPFTQDVFAGVVIPEEA